MNKPLLSDLLGSDPRRVIGRGRPPARRRFKTEQIVRVAWAPSGSLIQAGDRVRVVAIAPTRVSRYRCQSMASPDVRDWFDEDHLEEIV